MGQTVEKYVTTDVPQLSLSGHDFLGVGPELVG